MRVIEAKSLIYKYSIL